MILKNPIENRLNKKDSAMIIMTFSNTTEMIRVILRLIMIEDEECATFVVSYQLASKAYKEEQYDQAYEYALKGCENEDHPSKGCDLLAMMIIEGNQQLHL